MTHPLNNDEFHPQDMVDYGEAQAAIAIGDMDSGHQLSYTRDFVFALEQAGFISKIDEDDPTASATAALQALVAASLFKKTFVKAYQNAEKHLDAVERLNNQFNL